MDWLTYWNIYKFFERRKKAPKVAIEQYDIAENYLYGRGVTQNYEKAAEWFRLSATHVHRLTLPYSALFLTEPVQ